MTGTVSYTKMSWDTTNTSATVTVTVQVQTGNQPDLSDSTNFGGWSGWQTSSPYTMGSGGEYVQFMANLSTSQTNSTTTPKLKDVAIAWQGTTKAVDITGNFTKGPDYGIWQCTVDGQLLRRAIGVTMSIYATAPVFGGGTNTLTSTLIEEVEPRNTGK